MTTFGIEGIEIEIETDITVGMPAFTVVGLGDTAVQEARERVRSAIKNSGYKFPGTRITVNMAPADTRKSGPSFDLPIALGILISSGQCIFDTQFLNNSVVLGELALDGSLRAITGVLPIVIEAKRKGKKKIIVPIQNAQEASLVKGIEVYGIENISQLVNHFSHQKYLVPFESKTGLIDKNNTDYLVDFASICGQSQAKRALEIAAAGSHNVLMSGPPGAGKTLMAKAFAGILPQMTEEEAFEVSQIYSVANLLSAKNPLVKTRPFRTIHHTASSVSLVGGGKNPSPGEISLAHRGVLFLDELAEFPAQVLEVLRQPIEDRKITISRVSGTCEFPCDFSLIAAMNPPGEGGRKNKKLSTPFLDRFDLSLHVTPVDFEKLSKKTPSEKSEIIARRVQSARDIQKTRFQSYEKKLISNSEMGPDEIKKFCSLPPEAENLLKNAMAQFRLSARAYHRIIKVARSIADLEGEKNITLPHVAEALQYRHQVESAE